MHNSLYIESKYNTYTPLIMTHYQVKQKNKTEILHKKCKATVSFHPLAVNQL